MDRLLGIESDLIKDTKTLQIQNQPSPSIVVLRGKIGRPKKEWSDDEIAILRSMWLDYKDDIEIEKAINRSLKAIQTKRRELGLQTKFHPDRSNKQGFRGDGARSYTIAENEDILARYDSGESTGTISVSYGVTSRAINNKIDRMLLKREKLEQSPKMFLTSKKRTSPL
jgi:hypothetical protein